MRKVLLGFLCLGLFSLSPACKSPSKKNNPAKTASQGTTAQADEIYIRGVYAYAAGDTKGAMALWEKVLVLDSKHLKTLEAMKEARAKMEAVKALKKK